jgi:arylsulfatase A-like enzyme
MHDYLACVKAVDENIGRLLEFLEQEGLAENTVVVFSSDQGLHLKVLEKAGLIEGRRDAQRRPRRLAPLAMKDIAEWIGPFLQQWDTRFNNLDAHLANLKKQEK